MNDCNYTAVEFASICIMSAFVAALILLGISITTHAFGISFDPMGIERAISVVPP